MANWTDSLPEGVENPIVVEIRQALPKGRVGQKVEEFPGMDAGLRAQLQRLEDDPEWNNSKAKMLQEIGADHLTVLFLGEVEHWRAKTGLPGDRDRKPGPPGRDVNIIVHLPPTAAKTEEDEIRATQVVADWFESSELGRLLFRTARASGIDHIGARGRRYSAKADIGYLAKLEDIRDNIRSSKSPGKKLV